jgi:hypothetical protein
MQMTKQRPTFALLLAFGLFAACGGDDTKNGKVACTIGTSKGCASC